MASIDAQLQLIEQLNQQVKPADAEGRLTRLIQEELTPETAAQYFDRLSVTIESFLPRRRKRLYELLEKRLSTLSRDAGFVAPKARPRSSADDVRQFLQRTRLDLADLSEHHIFQWAANYRDFVDDAFEAACRVFAADSDIDLVSDLYEEFRRHSLDIFIKGYEHSSSASPGDVEGPVIKAKSGLGSFLELIVHSYSNALFSVTRTSDARAIRSISSAMLAGVLAGFAETSYGPIRGGRALLDSLDRWAPHSPLLVGEHLTRLLSLLPSGKGRAAIAANVGPLVQAIDAQTRYDPAVPCLPAFGFFDADRRRLEITLRGLIVGQAQPYLVCHTYLDPKLATTPQLANGLRRGVVLFIAPLEESVAADVEADPALAAATVDTKVHAHAGVKPAANRSREILVGALTKLVGRSSSGAPLDFNVARNFPLERPILIKYFFVNRPSVQNLLLSHEQQSGVRLWCSVRRSGKTTACFELGSPEDTILVTQTCNRTQQHPGATVLWDTIEAHIEGYERLAPSFLRKSLAKCTEGEATSGKRVVLLLDEYESVFERLRLAVLRDPEIRYRVAQPLLDQLVDLATTDLVILVGQRPDAHFILMDQNPLSPYVQQDQFPLFAHSIGAPRSEFRLLLDKVLAQSVEYEPPFANAVYRETQGHPFLTVNLLVTLVEWLMKRRYSQSDGALNENLFREFSEAELRPSRVEANEEFEFFHQVTGQALTDEYALNHPWLHCVYQLLRIIALESPTEMRLTGTETEEALKKIGLQERFGIRPGAFLRNATMANFLQREDDGSTRARIPLMARIAAAAPTGGG